MMKNKQKKTKKTFTVRSGFNFGGMPTVFVTPVTQLKRKKKAD